MKIDTISMEAFMSRFHHFHDKNTVQARLYAYSQQRDPQRKVICGYSLMELITPDVVGLPHPQTGEPIPVVYGLEEAIAQAPAACRVLNVEPESIKAVEVTYGWVIDWMLGSNPLFLKDVVMRNLLACARQSYEAKHGGFEGLFNKPGVTLGLLHIPPEWIARIPPDFDLAAKEAELRASGLPDEQCQCAVCRLN